MKSKYLGKSACLGTSTTQRLLLVLLAGSCALAWSCAGPACSKEEQPAPIEKKYPRDLRVDRLLEVFRSGSLDAKLSAHKALTALGPEVLPQLLHPLRSVDACAAWIAESIAMWGFRARAAAPVLAERLARGLDDAPVMAHALFCIGESAMPFVTKALKNGTDVGRQWAMDALDLLLEEPKPDPYLPEIVRALRSRFTPLRENAANALASLGWEASSAFPEMLAAAADPDETVRGNIADALGAFLDCEDNAGKAVCALLELLEQSEHSYSHRMAAKALGQDSMRDARGLNGLLDALEDPEATEEAAFSLVKLGVATNRAVDILLECAGKKPGTRTLDLAARLRTGGPRARRAAVRLLGPACRADTPGLRSKALHLLAFVGDANPEAARSEIQRALKDRDKSVRAAAKEALRALDRILAAR